MCCNSFIFLFVNIFGKECFDHIFLCLCLFGQVSRTRLFSQWRIEVDSNWFTPASNIPKVIPEVQQAFGDALELAEGSAKAKLKHDKLVQKIKSEAMMYIIMNHHSQIRWIFLKRWHKLRWCQKSLLNEIEKIFEFDEIELDKCYFQWFNSL